jgi:hypothetical protein
MPLDSLCPQYLKALRFLQIDWGYPISLSGAKVRNAKPKAKPYKISDGEGDGCALG